MQYVFFTLAFLTLFFISPSSATDLSLNEAIQEGLNHSPIIQKAQAALTESKWKETEVFGTEFLPKLSVNGTYFFDHKYEVLDVPIAGDTVSFPSIYPTTLYGVRVSIPLFDGFANSHKLESARLLQKATQKELQQTEFQLKETIRLAYYQALTAQKIQTVTAHHVTVLQEHLKQVQIQKKAGVATNYDMLRVQVQLSEAELDAADAQNSVEISRQNLTQLMGLIHDNRPLADNLPTPNIHLVSNLTFNPDLQERADIQAMDYRQKAAEQTQNATTPWLIPKLSAIGSYDVYNNKNQSITGDAFRTAYQTGLVLTWDLFDGNVAQARSEIAHAQQLQAQKTNEGLKLKAYSDFEQWKKRYTTNALRFKVKQLDSQRSEESVRLVHLEARAGTRTNTEVLDAELDLFRSKAGSVQAQMNATEALIKLELALGRNLE